MNEALHHKPKDQMLWFAILVIPFLLNDFANIYVRDYRIWLAIDYVFVKAFPFFLLIFLLRTHRLELTDLGLKRPNLSRLMVWMLIMIILGIAIDQIGWRFFEKILPNTKLGGMPRIPNLWLSQIDLYLGLLCVGIIEEIIFRGLAFTVFRKYIRSILAVFIVTSLIFGLIHWSWGLHAFINTAIIGGIFMVVMWKTGNVIPTIIAHFFVNYVSFSGIIPNNSPWFDFLK